MAPMGGATVLPRDGIWIAERRFSEANLARLRIGNASVDLSTRVIERGGSQVSIEPKVMAVLQMLISSAGEVVSRDQLIADIWDVRFGGDERLSRAISILRHALGDSASAQALSLIHI